MRKIIFYILFTFTITEAQWQNIWTSPNIPGSASTGYLSFQKIGNNWDKRIYYLDSIKFYISSSSTNLNPQYTYFFTPEEKLAGYQLYSLQTDLTGDGITEFYVIGYVGTSTDYRQYVKIFNIVNNSIVFQGNQNNYSYSYPTLMDINSDGLLECIFTKWNYPYNNTYFYEIYTTGVTSTEGNNENIGFNLNQNFPNPFNSETNISFTIEKAGHVRLKIYNVNGEELTTLIDNYLPSGNHTIKWNGSTKDKFITSGVYFYELSIDGKNSVKKMIQLK
ncbi:MAG: T9SS type A sorting domain-containing protein [Ignavibacterium sp.]|nr:T9SS type A sorting domain-containing protein [Ignavibacterium sp.]MDW8375113.1 T9SS type A sorting domain-containing protein [Ignavibacteriales bacterium]